MNQDNELNALVIDQARKILRLEAKVAEMQEYLDRVTNALGYGCGTLDNDSLSGLVSKQCSELWKARRHLENLTNAAELPSCNLAYMNERVATMVKVLEDHVAEKTD